MAEMIFLARTASDYEAFAALVREYVDWCRARYKHEAWFVEKFGHQELDLELRALATAYGPPKR